MSTPTQYDDDSDRIPGLATAFGAILRRHRRALDLTQEELAVEVEMDRTFLSLLERGQRRPSLATVFVLARRFGVQPSELVQEVEAATG